MPGTRDNTSSTEWFQEMLGFRERDYAETKGNLEFVGEYMTSKVNDKSYHIGNFETPTLEMLRFKCERACKEAPCTFWSAGSLCFDNIIGCTRALHLDEQNADAVFQVMSLYNCLETTRKGQGPDAGVTDYADRPTQGPAAAMSCPAATLYRNYCATDVGLRADKELDCLEALAKFVDNKSEGLWTMRRGLCMPRLETHLADLSLRIVQDPEYERDVEEKVQVGIHWSTEVYGGSHDVCQIFCSALPVSAMKQRPVTDWAGFAGALLEAAFDATLTASTVLAAQRGSRVKVYLTALGGGELGNRPGWIVEALNKVLHTHEKEPLDVHLVHYAEVPEVYRKLQEGRWKHDGREGAGLSHTLQTGLLRQTSSFLSTAEEEGVEGADSLTHAFAHFDTNGDGVLDKGEMTRILQSIDEDFFTDRVVNILFQEADCDGDGSIHYCEFVNWLCEEDEDITFKILDQLSHCPASKPNAPPDPKPSFGNSVRRAS